MLEIAAIPALFALLSQAFDENQARLNTLDAAIGDGDHGDTMARAFHGAAAATLVPARHLGACFDLASQALAEQAGGAIGPLLAAWFAEGGVLWAGKVQIDAEDFDLFLSRGIHAVQEVGDAQPGDKTLLDALIPAQAAFSAAKSAGMLPALAAAFQAAIAGVEKTKNMAAGRGRARFVGSRSLGHPDPGATSVAIILDGFDRLLRGERPRPVTIEKLPFHPPDGKLVNSPDRLIREDNEGLALAYPDLVRLSPEGILLRANPKAAGKVSLVIGHGGGHTPSMGCLVGLGLLDGDVYGPLFTCASGVRIAQAIHLADHGAGVALLISNHAGDVLNARLAIHRALQAGIPIEGILLGDDLSTAPRAMRHERRGLGGLLFALKIGGALAEAGADLQEVARIMRKTNERTATLAVAVKAPTHPLTGAPLFDLPPGQIEIGTGVHGEPGVYQGKHLPADQIVDLMLDRVSEDLKDFDDTRVLVFINGSGATSRMELHLIYRRVHERLIGQGFQIVAGVVESLFTTQDMGGFSLSLCAVDDEMLEYWQAPASAPAFRWPYK